MLKVWTTTICDVTRLEAEGSIDARQLGTWREALHGVAVDGAESVVVDVGRVCSWSVAAQAALIRAAHVARECGRRFSLVNASDALLEQARLCGLDSQLPGRPGMVRVLDGAPTIDLRQARVLPSGAARLRAVRVGAAAARRRGSAAGTTG